MILLGEQSSGWMSRNSFSIRHARALLKVLADSSPDFSREQ